MTKLKTIVVDDEPLALRLMMSFLKNIPELEIVAQCKNGIEAVNAVLELSPDLMFLDIGMPGLNGFEVIKKIQPELLPMVIFCTAHQRYALDAFDVHAVDYIVKPFMHEELKLTIKTPAFTLDGTSFSRTNQKQINFTKGWNHCTNCR